ncbi:MAG: phosphodiester glycosidase family protein, partial [Prochlorococcus sp.]
QLWLPLDFLVSRLGFVQSRVEAGDQLNWYGKTLPLASIATRTLDDEVSLNVAGWLAAAGVQRQIQGSTLRLHLNPPRLNGLRRG